jgi:hypothetical protein
MITVYWLLSFYVHLHTLRGSSIFLGRTVLSVQAWCE